MLTLPKPRKDSDASKSAHCRTYAVIGLGKYHIVDNRRSESKGSFAQSRAPETPGFRQRGSAWGICGRIGGVVEGQRHKRRQCKR